MIKFNADPIQLTKKEYIEAAAKNWEEVRAANRNRLNWLAEHIADREHNGHRIFVIDGNDYVCIKGFNSGFEMVFTSIKWIPGKNMITINTSEKI